MFQVTDKADQRIREIFMDKLDDLGIRVFLTEGGYVGPFLSMGLSNPREGDEVFDKNGIMYFIDRALFEEAKPVTVGFEEGILRAGFLIRSSLELDRGGYRCGSVF